MLLVDKGKTHRIKGARSLLMHNSGFRGPYALKHIEEVAPAFSCRFAMDPTGQTRAHGPQCTGKDQLLSHSRATYQQYVGGRMRMTTRQQQIVIRENTQQKKAEDEKILEEGEKREERKR